jgi:GMP synthase-like glutamine amidotransferase
MEVHKRVLILDGAIHPEIYQPTDHWTAHLGDVEWVSVRLPAGEGRDAGLLDSGGGFTHVIVTGSEDRIVSPRPWHEVEARLVREAAERDLSILGSCFGHQMLARELMSGRHAVESATPEMGWLPIEILEQDELLSGLGDQFFVFCSHFDEVITPEPGWRVLARSGGCGVQVMRWAGRPVWGIQAHPEIPPDKAHLLLEGFLRHNPDKEALIRPALSMEVRDDRVVSTIVKNFLEA